MDSDRDGKPTWPLLSVVDKKFLYQCHHRKTMEKDHGKPGVIDRQAFGYLN